MLSTICMDSLNADSTVAYVASANGPATTTLIDERALVPFKADVAPDAAAGDDSLNRVIGKHARLADDWQYADLHADIVIWEGRFNKEFFAGALPCAAISLDPDDIRTLGTYLLSRDGLALNYRININTKHLVDRDEGDVLRTLCHEQIHQWEHVAGRSRGGRYHTKAFRDKAAEIGIPVDRNGISLGPTPGGPFLRLLDRYGVHLRLPASPVSLPAQAQPRSTISPWTCSCTKVWVARRTELEALCGKCGERFVRV